MTTSRKIAIAALVVAIAVLVWDKARPTGSVTQPAAAQARSAATPAAQPTDPAPPQDNLLADLEKLNLDAWLARPQTQAQHHDNNQPSTTIPNNVLNGLLSNIIGPNLSDASPDLSGLPRDLFVASPTFLVAIGQHQPDALETELPPQPPTLPLLSAILVGPDYRCALLDDCLVFTGQNIGPWELTLIAPDHVQIQAAGHHATLTLDP